MKTIVAVLFVFLVAALLLGAAYLKEENPAALEVNVSLREYQVELSRRNIPAGVPVTFHFVGSGSILHEAVLERAGANDEPLEKDGEELEVEDVQPGETRSVTWVIDQPGMYQIACHIPGHFEGGMIQTFNVRSGGMLVASLFEYSAYIAGGLGVTALILLASFLIPRLRKSAKPA